MKKFLFFLLITSSIFAQEFKFIMMCDSRGPYVGVNDSILIPIVNHANLNHPDAKFVFFPGDMVDGNVFTPEKTVKELLHWKEVVSAFYNNPNMIEPKIFVTVGNHEIRNREDEKNFRLIFNNMPQNGPEDEKGLTYSFNFNKVHFAVINTDKYYYGIPEDTADDRRDWHYIKHLDWLEKDLKTARENGNKIIVVGHEMAFPTGGHLKDGLPNLQSNLTIPLDSTRKWFLNQRDQFWKILVDNDVSAYLCGHEHLYSRLSVNGIYQIISGSCGAPVYYHNPVFGDTTTILKPGQEMSYKDALPYYKILNYNYKPGENAQASEDFLGLRAFTYLALSVKEDKIIVETFGAFPKEGTLNVMGTDINLLDKFEIPFVKTKN